MPYFSGISWGLGPLLTLVLANDLCHEDVALIQVNNSQRRQHIDLAWQSPRDLAIVPPPQQVRAGAKVFDIYSAVPSFGEDGNFIALLLRNQFHGVPIFCAGSSRAHLTQVRIFGHAMLCDWPEEEKDNELFEVFLEDAQGKQLAKVTANRKSGLLKKYQTVACVRDVYLETAANTQIKDANRSAYSTMIKQLAQWLEYNWLHGVDHFFVYTYKGTDGVVKDVLEPYLQSGVATRIHFDDFPSRTQIRQKQMVNDCLYRAKSHAKWALPSLDTDEYFRITSKEVFPGGSVPQDYMRTSWDALIKHEGKKQEEVPAINFYKFLELTGFLDFFCLVDPRDE